MLWPIPSCTRASRHLGWKAVLACLAASALLTSLARAQDLVAENAIRKSTLDGQLVLALPAALQTGMSAGVGLGYLRAATASDWLA